MCTTLKRSSVRFWPRDTARCPRSKRPGWFSITPARFATRPNKRSFIGLADYKKLHKQGKRFGVLGCVAQQEGEKIFERAPHVSPGLRLGSYRNLPQMLVQLEAGNQRVTGLDDRETDECFETEFTARTNPHRGYITIIEGCDKFCAYCVVPFTRGKERSRTSDSVLAEARQMADLGYTEIQLLGQIVNSYKDPSRKDRPSPNCWPPSVRFPESGGCGLRPLIPGISAPTSLPLSSRSHAVRPHSPADSKWLQPRARRHAAAVHPRGISGADRLDQSGQA